jgi:hypothetical protein
MDSRNSALMDYDTEILYNSTLTKLSSYTANDGPQEPFTLSSRLSFIREIRGNQSGVDKDPL